MVYPALTLAYELIAKDNGMSPGTLPDLSDISNLALVEQFLAMTPADDLETLCVGDQNDWLNILQAANNLPGLRAEDVHIVLDRLFEAVLKGE